MLAREKQPSDADRRLYGARMVDPHFVLRHGCRERDAGLGFAPRQPFRQRRDGLPFVVADAPAAYREPVVRRVVAFIKRRYIPAREFIVLGFVGRDAVGVRGPEKGAGESLAGLGVDLRAFDGQPLLALGAVGAQFLLGENGVQEYLFCYGERFVEEFGEHAETDVGIVAVDVDVVVRAVIVEPFGDLVRRHVACPLGEHVGGGRRRERNPLHGRSGAEHEGDAQHFEVVRGERVERRAVCQQALPGLCDLDVGGYYEGWLCHFFAL